MKSLPNKYTAEFYYDKDEDCYYIDSLCITPKLFNMFVQNYIVDEYQQFLVVSDFVPEDCIIIAQYTYELENKVMVNLEEVVNENA